jgi:hypothetical protein
MKDADTEIPRKILVISLVLGGELRGTTTICEMKAEETQRFLA